MHEAAALRWAWKKFCDRILTAVLETEYDRLGSHEQRQICFSAIQMRQEPYLHRTLADPKLQETERYSVSKSKRYSVSQLQKLQHTIVTHILPPNLLIPHQIQRKRCSARGGGSRERATAHAVVQGCARSSSFGREGDSDADMTGIQKEERLGQLPAAKCNGLRGVAVLAPGLRGLRLLHRKIKESKARCVRGALG